MSAVAVTQPHSTYPRPVRLRPVPDPPPENPLDDDQPVTVTISISGGAGGRERVLAALRELVDAAGATAAVESGSAVESEVADEVRLDPRARTVWRGGRLLELSRLEYDLLLFLARHPRQVFSRSQLLTHVWGHRHTTNRTVDVHVSRLRTKLGDPELIATVYGLGYRLAEDAVIVVDERSAGGR